ncbi:type II secretion system F family protein [Pontiella sp.]|uniref:type II secretion system F family protein n=1 Tax=Pontiella sp. TaxID=2837462 RepID=UPI0035658FBE
MIWVVPSLFALCAFLMGWAILRMLGEAEESYAGDYTADTARQFEELFLFISPRQMLSISRSVATVVFFLLFFAAGNVESIAGAITGTVVGSLGAAAALFAQRLILRVLKIRRLDRFNNQLVDALANMSNALKAGFSIQQAFESVVADGLNPIAQEFGMFLQQLRVGVRFDEALSDMEKRIGSEDLMLMTQAIEISRQTGGNLTEVFDRIAETIRERRRIEGKIKSLTAQGRIQGIIVSLIPIFLAAFLYFYDPGMMIGFFRSVAGIAIMVIILILMGCGGLLIRRIVNIDV